MPCSGTAHPALGLHHSHGRKHLSGPGRGQGTVALPEMRKGRVALCSATLLARSTVAPSRTWTTHLLTKPTPPRRTTRLLSRSDEAGEIRLILSGRNWTNTSRHGSSGNKSIFLPAGAWTRDQHGERGPHPFTGAPAGWKEAGVRIIVPRTTDLVATQAGHPPNLTGLRGRQLLREMDKLVFCSI